MFSRTSSRFIRTSLIIIVVIVIVIVKLTVSSLFLIVKPVFFSTYLHKHVAFIKYFCMILSAFQTNMTLPFQVQTFALNVRTQSDILARIELHRLQNRLFTYFCKKLKIKVVEPVELAVNVILRLDFFQLL